MNEEYASIGYNEKLQMIESVCFGEIESFCSEEEVLLASEKLDIILPDCFRLFYLRFGKQQEFLKCMYNIATLEELHVSSGILMFAKEYQNVCAYGIDVNTGKVLYIDQSNNIAEELEQDADDFLLFLLAMQTTQFLPCSAQIDTECLQSAEDLEEYLVRITKNLGDCSVFCNPEGIIAVMSGEEIFVSAKNDQCMDRFEMESGFEIDFL